MSECLSHPEGPPETVCTALAPGVEGFSGRNPSPPCPMCGKPMRGRQTVACSGKCRVERWRLLKAQQAARRDRQVMAYLSTAAEALEAAQRLVERSP